jgi:hypothetical protein
LIIAWRKHFWGLLIMRSIIPYIRPFVEFKAFLQRGRKSQQLFVSRMYNFASVACEKVWKSIFIGGSDATYGNNARIQIWKFPIKFHCGRIFSEKLLNVQAFYGMSYVLFWNRDGFNSLAIILNGAFVFRYDLNCKIVCTKTRIRQ